MMQFMVSKRVIIRYSSCQGQYSPIDGVTQEDTPGQVFIELQKKYYALYKGRCLTIMCYYCVVAILFILLYAYWTYQHIISEVGIR